MPDQLSGATAILVSETDSPNYFAGGDFRIGTNPRTELTVTIQDDDTAFDSLGVQSNEANGAGRQLGTLRASDNSVFDIGAASLNSVLSIFDPISGTSLQVGRVQFLVDDQSFGSGPITQEFFIFSAPIDPAVTYQVTSIDYAPGSPVIYNYATFQSSSVVCFARGTLIRMQSGCCAVEQIKAGDLVQTIDNGVKRVCWVGEQHFDHMSLRFSPKLRPVLIAPGVFDNDKPLLVSQQHRILLGDRFIKARHLPQIAGMRARVANGLKRVSYYHLLLEDHQVLLANNIPAESLYLGAVARTTLIRGEQADRTFVKAADGGRIAHALVRPELKRKDIAGHRIGPRFKLTEAI